MPSSPEASLPESSEPESREPESAAKPEAPDPSSPQSSAPELNTPDPSYPGPQKTPGTWQTMVDSNKALLLRKTGKDTAYWAAKAQAAGVRTDAGLRDWMRDGFGVTGYAQYAVSWEMFGYPDFMLRGADELLDAQYAKHPHLRPIADSLLAWAAATEGVGIQMRKGYVSLHSPRRKFAQVTRTTNSAVDVTLRMEEATAGDRANEEATGRATGGAGVGAGEGARDGATGRAGAGSRLEKVRARPDDPFTVRVRLTGADQVDEELLGILAKALDQNS